MAEIENLQIPTERRWDMRPVSLGALSALEGSDLAEEVPPAVLTLLAQRGFDCPEKARAFLHPKLRDLTCPFEMPDMRAAVERIFAAADEGEEVVLYGDYDVDGVTSLTLLTQALRAYGLDPKPFLPHRIDEGYGVTREGLERCLLEFDPDLLIAVDCGTGSLDEIADLRARGIDVIVLDHHEPSPNGRPDVIALVNPKAADSDYQYLCSAGVAFKLAHALVKARPNDGLDLKKFLDIAAVGTVADIVPLVEENRILVRHGLRRLQATENRGLSALKSVARVSEYPAAMDIGFRIGPRLNAAGRMDTAQAALDLLLSETDGEAACIAEELDLKNRERQNLERRIREEAENSLGDFFDPARDPSIVIGSHTWHPGVVGIVASRLVSLYYRPAIVIAFDENGVGKGSGRSVPGVSLVQAIESCGDLLLGGGGHDMAAGISIERANLEAFRQRFRECVLGMVEPEVLHPRLMIDAELTLEEITPELMAGYDLLEPFGSENPQPLFMARRVMPMGEPRRLKDKHLKLRLRQSGGIREAMFFNGAERPLPPPPWDVAFKITRNFYNGFWSIQLCVEDIRAAAG